MNSDIYGKKMEKLRNRIDVKLVKNKKDFKMYVKTKLYVGKIIWQYFSCNM